MMNDGAFVIERTFNAPVAAGKTRVKLTHAGLETFPANNPDFARGSFEMGWTDIIGRSLKGYLKRE